MTFSGKKPENPPPAVDYSTEDTALERRISALLVQSGLMGKVAREARVELAVRQGGSALSSLSRMRPVRGVICFGSG